MIRRILVAVADQAVLSGVNFGLALLLIRFGTKEEYGLYSQLINLQSLFSPFHAGVFVSAYLALSLRFRGEQLLRFRTAMARAELGLTLISAFAAATIMFIGARLVAEGISWTTCAAAAAALIGLWWREFVRATRFAAFRHDLVLRFDCACALLTLLGMLWAIHSGRVSVVTTLLCAGGACMLVSIGPLTALARDAAASFAGIRSSVVAAWQTGKWDVFGSCLTWGYSQTYVYFAALLGGLSAAAEISAARLLAMPLALIWASYANVLIPRGSQLLQSGSADALGRLARRSAVLVVAICSLYAIALVVIAPTDASALFGAEFRETRPLALLWIGYFSLAGLSTVASSLLRSALEFRHVFLHNGLSCVLAITLLSVSLLAGSTAFVIIALMVAEGVLAVLLWRCLSTILSAPIARDDLERGCI